MKRKLRPLLLVLCCLLIPAAGSTASVRFSYVPDTTTVLLNPYMGNAVWATDDETEQPFTLVYANLLWSVFEPQEGVFDFASFEEENQFERWRAEGKHLILRFVLDMPGRKKHMDIPEWLYDQTGDGTYYRVEYGRGYSPNYENPVLIAAHARAIRALGERYGSDPFVAFVQLGSLGHWGEWHVHDDVGILPAEAIRRQYVEPYIAAFPNTFLMARRPFGFAKELGFGLFNDTSAEPSATQEWLNWIAAGGDYQDEPGALLPMPDAWKTVPIGGELANSVDVEELLGDELATTLHLFEASHTSWIGPHSFAGDVAWGSQWQAPLDTLLTTIGYRLRVESATLESEPDGTRKLTLLWQNDGVAPFYFDWQPALRLCFENQEEEQWIALDMELKDLLPQQSYEVSVTLPDGAYAAYVGIVSPHTGAAGIQLAMHTAEDRYWYQLFEME